MPWVHAFFLWLLAVLIGWIPVLGPLALGFVAARAEPRPRALLVLLPALLAQTVLVLLGHAAAGAIQHAALFGWPLQGWLWTAVSWLLSPVATLIGRPLTSVLATAPVITLLLVFLAPVLPGLLLGLLGRRR